MKIIATVKEMQRYAKHNHKKGRRIGFVPTMGYFHDGHVALMREARSRCDRVVVSIFVNPLQFGHGEDFASYPRDMKRDLELARENRVNVVFTPSSDELYPGRYSTFVEEEKLSKKLCGAFRPGHFKGVATVVAKLFNIVRPHTAFFGQKDAQQAAIIRKMISDLNYPIHMVVVPTAREAGGLACSSRNDYLASRERREAAVIYRSLLKAREMVRAGARDPRQVVEAVRKEIGSCALATIEYVEAVHPETLERVGAIDQSTLLAAAVRIGKARLIDNIVLEP